MTRRGQSEVKNLQVESVVRFLILDVRLDHNGSIDYLFLGGYYVYNIYKYWVYILRLSCWHSLLTFAYRKLKRHLSRVFLRWQKATCSFLRDGCDIGVWELETIAAIMGWVSIPETANWVTAHAWNHRKLCLNSDSVRKKKNAKKLDKMFQPQAHPTISYMGLSENRVDSQWNSHFS